MDTDAGLLELRGLTHISVDEYQDFSPGFQGILDSLVGLSQAKVFAVGDDWQSIYGFMGAKPEIFSSFRSRMSDSVTLELLTNHRSAGEIVRLGNLVMAGRGSGARARGDYEAGKVAIFDVSTLNSVPHERFKGVGSRSISAARLISAQLRDANHQNVILSRMSKNPTQVSRSSSSTGLDALKKSVTKARGAETRDRDFLASSTHKFKGRESSAVIIWDADGFLYPFVHPTWFYLKVFGDSLEGILAEERRLLYVAITRAEDTLYILFDREISPFLKKLATPYLDKIDSYAQEASVKQGELHVIVSKAFDIKDALKAEGFTWNKIDKTWSTIVPTALALSDTVRDMESNPPAWLLAARRGKAKVQLRSQSETIVI